MLSRFVKRHSGFTRRFAVVIPEMVLVTMVMDVVPVTCTVTPATKSCAPARHRQHPPQLLSPRPGNLALVLVNPSPRPSGSSPAPGASDEDSAELRALHSDYIENIASNYANDFSDPPPWRKTKPSAPTGSPPWRNAKASTFTMRTKPLAPETEDLRRQHHVPRSSTYERFTHWSCPNPLQDPYRLNHERSILSMGQAG
jgi:hypothetical protein